ncbi:hypothetical protein OEA41_006260 [Lepraria neglecta]|uniref:Stress-response A/B barrel domain-containing protein n=1 Tax=Lepraria neglecta TaxID=209136 RepID=A0AAD9Z7A4_9LECA|nr:hypothetical protein OEA41_006260 [Lepraria neglecta]
MAIVHIVLFQFKPQVQQTAVQDVCRRMLALKDQCMHPTTNKPYLKTSVGGKDNSPEGIQHGITHGFVVEFESIEDRDYVTEDPVHQGFLKSIGDVVEKAQVIDFTPDVY